MNRQVIITKLLGNEKNISDSFLLLGSIAATKNEDCKGSIDGTYLLPSGFGVFAVRRDGVKDIEIQDSRGRPCTLAVCSDSGLPLLCQVDGNKHVLPLKTTAPDRRSSPRYAPATP